MYSLNKERKECKQLRIFVDVYHKRIHLLLLSL